VELAERQIRGGKNQALFRDVNEQIKGVLHMTYIDFLCECADMECMEIIRLKQAEYETVRTHPERFPIKPGHDVPELERVVEEHDRYVVVEKVEAAAEAARKLDPRGRKS
jgi:hypothetical protein